jgi:hypothetical protein
MLALTMVPLGLGWALALATVAQIIVSGITLRRTRRA